FVCPLRSPPAISPLPLHDALPICVVLITVKLQWVDEHRDDDEVVFGSGLFKERAVALVQGAHGWYETDCWRWVAGGNEFGDFVSDLGFSSGGRGGKLSLFKGHDI